MDWTTSTTQLMVLVGLSVVSVDIVRRLVQSRLERKGYPLPPGPTPLPLLGSALSVNFDEPFRTYTEWREKYGDIMYIRLLDMDVVVLNSPSIISELLEKRSQIYSNRPHIASAEPYGHDTCNFSLAQYGDQLKLCRRIFHQTFGADAAATFHPIQLRKARQMVLTMISDPSDYSFHYSTFSASIAMHSVYDYDPKSRNDEIVASMYDFLEISVPALLPERAILLKIFPFLLHIPDWLPGSSIKREARRSRELSVNMVEAPYQYVKMRMASKEGFVPSMVSDHITHMEKLDVTERPEYEKTLKLTASSAFMGSVETTSSILTNFTLAMVKNPHVWKRAQAEIGAVLGSDKLPEFHDRPSLPYVDAILRETLRWQPVVPLGVPHATATSDLYEGFYIPKGATVFANIWGITRDELRYPDAEKFNPDRYLDAEGMLTEDTVEYIFGFGRRACPGRHTGDASLWCAIATMLAALDFNCAKDSEGGDTAFEVKWLNGIARHPLPFPCRITPRSPVIEGMLKQVLAD